MNNEAKKKAKELIDWAMNEYAATIIVCNMRLHKHRLKKAKKIALKVCEEVLNIKSVDKDYDLSDHWEQVKTEIENYE